MTSYLVAVGIIALIYGLLALGLNLQWGHTGLVNFGHVAFFAIGAYTSALLTLGGAPIIVGILAALVAGGLAAYPLGWLTIRLREDYLALVAIGFGEVTRLFLENESWLTNGPSGLPGIPRFFAFWTGLPREAAYMGLLVVVVIVVYALLERLVASPFGRTLRAIRDNEIAVIALGKDTVHFKLRSFVIGAAIAGMAGAFYAHYMTFISPDMFLPMVTFHVWIAVIIGGSGHNLGVLVGTGLLMVFLEGSRFLNDFGLNLDESRFAALRLVIVGLALVLVILKRPEGLFGASRSRKGREVPGGHVASP